MDRKKYLIVKSLLVNLHNYDSTSNLKLFMHIAYIKYNLK